MSQSNVCMYSWIVCRIVEHTKIIRYLLAKSLYCFNVVSLRTESRTTIGYRGAISFIERRQVPAVGLTKDRQVLRKLGMVYNDDNVCSLICFVCGQIHTKTPCENSQIDWIGGGWLASLNKAKQTLQANCGWDRWCEIYGSIKPLDVYGPGRHRDAPQEEWCLEICLCPAAFHIYIYKHFRPPDAGPLVYILEHSQVGRCRLVTAG